MYEKGCKRPNVVVFFTDQQRWDTAGIHGNPLGLTPNLDRMAVNGTHLNYCFTVQPVCGPARACIQTGMYATKVGCFKNDIPLPKDAKTLAHCFKDAGYKTGYIGKWHLASDQAVKPEQRGGYEYWLAANTTEMCSQPYDTVLFNNECESVKLPGYRVDAMTDAGIRYMHENKDNPFFLFMSFLEPHHQNNMDNYPAPDGYADNYISRWMPPDLSALGGTAHQHLPGYYGMVKKLDEALGRVMDALKSMNLLEDTIILFTTDHGSHFKTRNREYKRSCHESSIRIPGVLYGSVFNGGGRVNELVSLVDLPATLLDAAGLDVPDSLQGKSILPLLKGDKENWPEEVFIQISESQVARAVRTKRWKYGVHAPDKNGGKDSCSDTYIEQYLYDLNSDPYELNNLIGVPTYKKVCDVMKERLLRRMVEVGEKTPVIICAEETDAGQRMIFDGEECE